jgi:hypothetical protein
MTRRVKEDRVEALKFLINESQDAGAQIKRILLALIEASDGLTKPVYFTDFTKRVACGISDVLDQKSDVHLKKLFCLLGTKFQFSSQFGHFDSRGFRSLTYPGKLYTVTIWFSPFMYDRSAKEVTSKQIHKILKQLFKKT